MRNFAILFFEPGMPESIPGVNSGVPSLAFPFWGNYTFLDFHLSRFTEFADYKIYLIFEEKQRNLALKTTSSLKKETAETIILENGVHSLISKLQELDAESLIFSSFAYIAAFDVKDLINNHLLKAEENLRISIDGVPLEFYVVKTKTVLNSLAANLNENTEKMDLYQYVFKNTLENAFEHSIDIPGRIFFHNNLLQLYQNNLWLISNQFHAEYLKLLSFPAVLNPNPENSYIGFNGCIKNSFISMGVEIYGTIENSIIFSNVIVHENSYIRNAVIMNNNHIGKNCSIQNTIVFPYFDEIQNNYYNINDNAMIGGKASNVKNNDYPGQINGGLCLIGINANIPRNFIIETGCCVGANKPEKELRKLEKLKRGTSYL